MNDPIANPESHRRSSGSPGSAATSSNTNLWRRYKLTHVTVAWQERHAGMWCDYSKQITHKKFLKHYSQVPPNKNPRPGGENQK